MECIGGVEAAKDYVLAALNEGKSVVTSNKELVCKYSHELERAARRNGCGLYFEASCVGGVPVIRTLLDGVQSNQISGLMGIINGTTNYILTKMTEEGGEYAAALAEAQKLGYAEADPANDVEGVDAAYKLAILASLAFHTKVPYAKVYREGISSVEQTDIAYGKQLGYTLKLLAIGKHTERGVEARVHPVFIRNSHPLASVRDAYNAVYLTGDCMDDIMLYGRGGGSASHGQRGGQRRHLCRDPFGDPLFHLPQYGGGGSGDQIRLRFRKRLLYPPVRGGQDGGSGKGDGDSRQIRRFGHGTHPEAGRGRNGRPHARRDRHARHHRELHPRRGQPYQCLRRRLRKGAHPRGSVKEGALPSRCGRLCGGNRTGHKNAVP